MIKVSLKVSPSVNRSSTYNSCPLLPHLPSLPKAPRSHLSSPKRVRENENGRIRGKWDVQKKIMSKKQTSSQTPKNLKETSSQSP